MQKIPKYKRIHLFLKFKYFFCPKTFNVDVRDLNWRTYIEAYCLGEYYMIIYHALLEQFNKTKYISF